MPRLKIDNLMNMDDRPTKRALMQAIGTLQGMYDVLLKPCNPTRSTQQNRFYFKTVVTAFENYLSQQGESYTKEQCHQIIAMKNAPIDVVNPVTGEVIDRVGKSTRQMSIEEFSEYTERAMAWLAETFGIEFAGPGLTEPAIAGKGMR